ncbi:MULTISPECIES: serine/threonine-protein kinase [unclassified Streptomyces]|uniref:serine/threonine-protein kinase n=1 Tax=unclassified Streptomyces TaxID=2593676 RepID=UPI00087BE3DC|nr:MULTISPECIES: serine/threonine-protein kinase [unclassified Streptomyces]REH18397.1 serine/threonine protein kinase [Streptomyces sp. 2221.1]SDS22734.1 Serine/threonine protein kinase [Streptomyces sp. 2114.2]
MERIGAYVVERVLGEGGMGTVYLARSRGGRAVAVKVAKPELARDPGFRERFRTEVAAARAVGGFHTAPVVDADPEAPAPWMATAYIPGPTLAGLLATQGAMGERALRQLGLALAEALQAIHSCGLVHRDLKPGNIIMAGDGPRVVDFGIARAVEGSRLTVTGIAVGTPGFLAPEQAEGLPVTPAADVFALGAVLIAASGGSAFGDGTPAAMMYRSVHHEPDLTTVPPALCGVIAACMGKKPQQRPAAGQLLDLLSLTELGGPLAYEPTQVASMSPPPMPAHQPLPPSLPPTSDADAESPQLLAMDRKNAIVADIEGISLGNNGRTIHLAWPTVHAVTYEETGRGLGMTVTVHLADGTAHACRVTTRDEEELDGWIDQLILAREHFIPGR